MIPLTEWEQAEADREHSRRLDAVRREALHAKAVARRRKAKRGGKR